MKSEATLEFISQVQVLVTRNEFERYKSRLFTIDEEHRSSFVSLIIAGYPITTAFRNYKKLYNFVEGNCISYILGIRMLTNIAKDSEAGHYVYDFMLHELN